MENEQEVVEDDLTGIERQYSIYEAAIALNVSQRHLRRLCNDGKVTATKPWRGANWRISKSVLDEMTRPMFRRQP